MTPLAEQDRREDVVGICAAVQNGGIPGNSRLKECSLTNPDWEATREVVARHYPAGTKVSGIWLRRHQEDGCEQVVSLVQLLINSTSLKVIEISSLFAQCSYTPINDILPHPHLGRGGRTWGNRLLISDLSPTTIICPTPIPGRYSEAIASGKKLNFDPQNNLLALFPHHTLPMRHKLYEPPILPPDH